MMGIPLPSVSPGLGACPVFVTCNSDQFRLSDTLLGRELLTIFHDVYVRWKGHNLTFYDVS
jgi:hypothetical protein